MILFKKSSLTRHTLKVGPKAFISFVALGYVFHQLQKLKTSRNKPSKFELRFPWRDNDLCACSYQPVMFVPSGEIPDGTFLHNGVLYLSTEILYGFEAHSCWYVLVEALQNHLGAYTSFRQRLQATPLGLASQCHSSFLLFLQKIRDDLKLYAQGKSPKILDPAWITLYQPENSEPMNLVFYESVLQAFADANETYEVKYVY